MDALNFSCQGDSHIATGKVCQDYSYSKVYEDGNAIAIVCDGHGGKRYFRSDIGARIAAGVTERKVRTFVEEAGASLLKGQPFTQRGTISEQIANQDFDKTSNIERAFRQLFGSIIYEWNTEVFSHAEQNPISDSEKEGLEECWITEFEEKAALEKVYGCTLIACVFTPEFWFAFQIGDGKCFAVDESGKWSEPIPWDDRCFLNKTTSICDSDAIDEFRFCYQGEGNFPFSIILGSDGIDDSFGTPENQSNFYTQILKSISTSGQQATMSEIESTLPKLSKIGSHDDMSLAMIFSEEKVRKIFPNLIAWQIANVKQQIRDEDEKLTKAHEILKFFENTSHLTRQQQIELQYASVDEKRALVTKEILEGRLIALSSELNINENKNLQEEGSILVNGNLSETYSTDKDSDSITISEETE